MKGRGRSHVSYDRQYHVACACDQRHTYADWQRCLARRAAVKECVTCLGEGQVKHQGIPVACPGCQRDAAERNALSVDLRRQRRDEGAAVTREEG